MTFCYSIKYGDISCLRHAIREMMVIFQFLLLKKPKHVKAILRKLHIFDIAYADLVLQDTYLTNTLINLLDLPDIFYKMNFLLEYQNGKFNRFCAN